MLEVMDAISNFTAVWRGLWLNDPTPQVLTKLMINVNWGAQIGRTRKGRPGNCFSEYGFTYVGSPQDMVPDGNPDPHVVKDK